MPCIFILPDSRWFHPIARMGVGMPLRRRLPLVGHASGVTTPSAAEFAFL